MNLFVVFCRTLLTILLPKNRLGDKIYSFINFIFKQGRFPTNKMLFNDVIYRIKTGDEILNPLRSFTQDKEYSKIYVKFMVGEEFCVPTIKIFKKYEDVVDYNFPSECCIKPTHSSGTFIMRTNDSKIDYHKIKEWFSENYYFRSREVNYRFLTPKVIVEPLLFGDSDIRDYRFFCYKGKVKLIMVDREPKHSLQIKQRTFFDLKWNEQTFKLAYKAETVPKPSNLEQMISIAEKLSSDFDFIRIDIFSNGAKCFVGEITHIHANASQKFIPTSDEKIVSKIIFG